MNSIQALRSGEEQSEWTFLGHPKGLAYLAFTEMWERFSYYGMTALLALYMTKQLLLPGHSEHVAGLAALRHLFELRGPMSNIAFASLIYGWYGGLVYFTPVIGGLIADRWLGTRTTVVLGALLMSAGHLAMSFDQSFLIALLMLILGSGCLKGNISAQVGQLYPPDEETQRTGGFTIFSAAINIGAVAGPLGCGAVAAIYGWSAGFGLAAALMILALIIYLSGQRHLPGKAASAAPGAELPPLTSAEKKRVALLVIAIALTVLPNVAYPMIWNIGILFINDRVSLATPFGAVPASWFNSIDAFASIVVVPPLVALWAWQARRGKEPSDVAKIGIGCAITGISAAILALGCAIPGADGKVGVIWPILCFVGMGLAFIWYWPVLLALISLAAPKKVNSTLMGASFLSLFVGSVLMGWVGSFYDQLSPAAFWMVDSGIGFAGALLVLVLGPMLKRALEPRDTESKR
ncbi:MAG TPA: peptide MFS transporter [Sphingomicrobium sp.]|nr:peptide MFS transporter [Sphingomicrobium sp.]